MRNDPWVTWLLATILMLLVGLFVVAAIGAHELILIYAHMLGR